MRWRWPCRINTNAQAVVLEGDIRRHGFRAGPVVTFQRNGLPEEVQIYLSIVFPYFFVSTSIQPRRQGKAAEPEAAAAAAVLAEPAAVAADDELGTDASVRVACFDSDDLLHVMHAVVKKLAEQDSRGAESIAHATRATDSDDVGIQVNIVPVPYGSPQNVFEAGADGFTDDELRKASLQKAGDVGALLPAASVHLLCIANVKCSRHTW